MATRIDWILGWLKWPLGLLSLACVPGLVFGLWDLVVATAKSPLAMAPFVGGVVAYWAADRLLFRRRLMGSAFSTFEHELTHAVMAWLTFRGVSGLKVTWSDGGHIGIKGGSNWLISLGPYFFPTFSVAIALALFWMPMEWLMWANVLLGASFGYHLISTWRETHLEQEDLKKAGRPFSMLFLPGAFLLWSGGVVAFAQGSLWAYVSSTWGFYF